MKKVFNHDNTSGLRNYYEIETQCEYLFNTLCPFWHLFTNGHKTEILLTNNEDFEYGMNLIGICADKSPKVKIYTFALMSNHIHCIMSGEKSDCEELFLNYKKRLIRYLSNKHIIFDRTSFNASFLQILNINSLRHAIAYVNRNGYISKKTYTPFSYPWGANYLYYNIASKLIPTIPFSSLTMYAKRAICKSKDVFLSDKIKMQNNIISPLCFCYIKEGESFFRSAHHYFNLLSKNYEAYSEIAKEIHSSVFISDEEMFSAVSGYCTKKYNINKPSILPAEEKIEIAKKMHFDYNASNGQITRILKLETSIVELLFPPVSL